MSINDYVSIDRPILFAGTAEQAAENYASHYFDPETDRCWECDSKTSHAAASYPCGTRPPREVVTISRIKYLKIHGIPR
jgi:hypothetical protein